MIVVDHKSRWHLATHLTEPVSSLHHFEVNRFADFVRSTSVPDVATFLAVGAKPVGSSSLIELGAGFRDATFGASLKNQFFHRLDISWVKSSSKESNFFQSSESSAFALEPPGVTAFLAARAFSRRAAVSSALRRAASCSAWAETS